MKTLKDIVAEKEPGKIDSAYACGVWGCPRDYDYLDDYTDDDNYSICVRWDNDKCSKCWNREVDTNES